MPKSFYKIISILLVFLASTVYAEELHHEIPLNGKLITAEDPATIGNNFQTLKNMRYTDNTIRGVGGMTQINTTAITDFLRFQNCFQFTKDMPFADTNSNTSYMLCQNVESDDTDPTIITNTTAIPNQGNFTGGATATALYTEDTAAGIARFSDAPNGQVAIADGKEALIWGGDEMRLARFVNADGNDEKLNWEYTEQVTNNQTGANYIATLNQGTEGTPLTTFYIGATRPLEGAYFDVNTANTTANTMAVYYHDGTDFSNAVGSLTDSTDTGASLAQDGWMTWTSAPTTHKASMLFGDLLYWYKFVATNACDAGTKLNYVTVADAMQPIKDLWDGSYTQVSAAFNDINGVVENTLGVLEADYSAANAATTGNFDSMGNTNSIWVGFTEKVTGIDVIMSPKASELNGNGCTLAVKFFDGNSWSAVTGLIDGTSDGTNCFGQSGTITWTSTSSAEIKTRNLTGNAESGTIPLYYYEFETNNAWDTDVKADLFQGILKAKDLGIYKFPIHSKNRLFLCGRQDKNKNSCIVSAVDQPDVYNGDDSTELFFGDEKELTGGIGLYSRLGSNIYDITLFFKKHSMYGLSGFTPEDFQPYTVSQSIGLVAPLTLKTTIITTPQGTRPIAIWQADNGIYIYDNTSPIEISRDIDNFWDENEANANKLHASYVDDSIGCIDNKRKEYIWLFADGSSSGTLNREMHFDLIRLKWFEVDRSSDLQSCVSVVDTDGNPYVYGTLDTGYMERLENGNDFDGTNITHTFQTGDIAPKNGSIMWLTQLIRHKLVMVDTGTTATVAITHYGDGKTTGTSLTAADPTNTGYRIADVNEKVNIGYGGHIFHSLKYVTVTGDQNPGFHPLFIGQKYNVLREDLE